MGGSTIATSETKIEALKLQSSAYGATIPVVGGVNRIPGNLIWYGDFKSTPHTSTEGQGGKGGGVKTQNTTYTYSASVLMGVCQGPIGAIARVWKGKEVFEGGWSAANVQRQTDTYTLPASGTMATTLSHAATLIGTPDVSYDITISYTSDTTGATWSVTETRRLASGADYSLSGGVMTFSRDDLRGTLVKIAYQWGNGAPDLSPLATLGITLANGDMSQAAATWLTTAHAGQALAYPGLAYVHAQNYQLGSGAQVDNHSFEVQGSGAYRYGSTSPDCNPAEFTSDLMANGRYGARLPVSRIDVKAWIDYCAAAGLLMSPLLTEQQRASDFIDEICRLTNSAPVWSVDRLRIVPYGDTAVTGNGVTYTPNVTPLYDLDDDSWLQDGSDDPLQWSLKEPADRYNHVRVEFCDRANYYNKTIAEAKDDADISVNGLRTMSTISAPWICDAAVARLVAQLVLQRSLNISGAGRVVLPWAYCLLECMDLVTITDQALGFNKLPVRITAIGENEDGRLEVELEDWPLGTAAATRYPSQVASGFLHDYNASPGNVDAPIIFEAPGALSTTGLEVYAAVRGSSALWGGCQVWVSLDGTQYKLAGTVYGGSRYGTLSSAVASTAAVQGLGSQQLLSGTAADATALQTLCWIGGTTQEYLAYTTATLTGAGAYTLGGLERAAYGTTSTAHSAGNPFVRVDDRIGKSGALDLALIGKVVHFKFVSFNVYGLAFQDLADVVDYTHTITGQFVGAAGGGSGDFLHYVFTRSLSDPPTPTGNGTPAGWYDLPPDTIAPDPSWTNVSTQLAFTGNAGDSTYTDPKGLTWSNYPSAPYNGAAISDEVLLFGQNTLKMDANDFITGPVGQASMLMNSSAWCAQGWIYMLSMPTLGGNTLYYLSSSAGTDVTIYIVSSHLRMDIAGQQYSHSATVPINQWVHWYVGVKDGVAYLAVDGVMQTGSTTPPSVTGTVTPTIGSTQGGVRYIGQQRLTKGVADYVANFAVPTGPLPTGDSTPWTDPLYFSAAWQHQDGTLISVDWSKPVRISGSDGFQVQYSVDGLTGWHSNFTSGDLYMRQRVGTGPWTSAIKIVGEAGVGGGTYVDYIFKRAATQPSTPTSTAAGAPSGWADAPPAADGNPLWMSKGSRNADGTLSGSWSTPVKLTGEDGAAPSTLFIDTAAFVLPAAADGTVATDVLAAAICHATVKLGNTDTTTLWNFAAAGSPGVSASVSGNTITLTSCTADYGTLTITANRAGFPSMSAKVAVQRVRGALSVTMSGGSVFETSYSGPAPAFRTVTITQTASASGLGSSPAYAWSWSGFPSANALRVTGATSATITIEVDVISNGVSGSDVFSDGVLSVTATGAGSATADKGIRCILHLGTLTF